jgi:phosphoribosylformylglycinamidine (FGAM) synthase-like amidotransferase family enzyme
MKRKSLKSLVVSGNGINCEAETAHANRLVGFDVDIVHINALMSGAVAIHQYGFVESGKLIIGICNGFQLLVKTGLLPALGGVYGEQAVTLTFNNSGRFEDRWVYLKVNELSSCIFTRDIDRIYLPVRHGEGKLVPADGALQRLHAGGHVVMQYCDASGNVTEEYPLSPNGSTDAIAALCDASGRIFGLMPHPEAFVHFTQHPRWTRENLPEDGQGLAIFRNAFRYLDETT